MSKVVWYSAVTMIESIATRFLDGRAIPYKVITHDQIPSTLEEAALARKQKPGQVIRSILFRVKPGQFVMVLMAGPGQISWQRVRTHLGISRLSMATESEVKPNTGCEIGTVNPFGIPDSIRLLADESVFSNKEISVGCGVRGSAIIIKSEDLHKALENMERGIFSP